MTKTTEQFINEAKQIHGDKYDYTKVDYVKCNIKVVIVCKIHKDFLQIPKDHLRGHGCKKCGIETSHNLQKKSKEQFILDAKQIHGDKYDYSKVDYINCNTKILITCEFHEDFLQTPDSHLSGNGCKKCGVKLSQSSRTKTTEQFLIDAKQIHGDKYDYSKVNYINDSTKIEIICKIHGSYIQVPSDHIQKRGCKKCGIILRSISNTKSQEEFINQVKQIHGYKYDYSKVNYINDDKKVEILCKIHGLFIQAPNSHIQGKGCKKCGLILISDLKTKSQEQFIFDAKQIHGDKYDYSKVNYINCNIKVEIVCKSHGGFEQNTKNHLQGAGCPRCVYKTETKCIEYLELISEEKFKKCKPTFLNGLELDGYSEKLGLAIEYNGEQHYEFIEFFHRNGPEDFEAQQERDSLKQKLCSENGVYLIVVPYYTKNLEQFISQKYNNYLFFNWFKI